MNYGSQITEIITSSIFDRWLTRLRDGKGRAIIAARIERLAAGNAGDVKPVGEGISEMRISFGPGYRIYFKEMGNIVIVLLVGGDKSTQTADIKMAKLIAKEWMQAKWT